VEVTNSDRHCSFKELITVVKSEYINK
jgi:hypothetical protein